MKQTQVNDSTIEDDGFAKISKKSHSLCRLGEGRPSWHRHKKNNAALGHSSSIECSRVPVLGWLFGMILRSRHAGSGHARQPRGARPPGMGRNVTVRALVNVVRRALDATRRWRGAGVAQQLVTFDSVEEVSPHAMAVEPLLVLSGIELAHFEKGRRVEIAQFVEFGCVEAPQGPMGRVEHPGKHLGRFLLDWERLVVVLLLLGRGLLSAVCFANAALQPQAEDESTERQAQNARNQELDFSRHTLKPSSRRARGSGRRARVMVGLDAFVSTCAMIAGSWRRGLVARKEAWLKERTPSVVVVGNSGGDVDSMMSALATAHLVEGVALAAFNRSEARLRRDAVALLGHYGLESFEELTCIDELGEAPLDSVVLVDHNSIEPATFGTRSPTVSGILDHHADAGLYDSAPLFRVVDPACGSTCTIVAERLLAKSETSPDLLGLLVSTIALDTRGFDPAKQRFSQRDVRVVHSLLDALGAPSAEDVRYRTVPGGIAADVASVAAVLLKARTDVSDLTASELLRMDYKQASAGSLEIGVAGCLATLDDLCRRALDRDGATLGALLRELADERRLDLVFAMTMKHKQGDRTRKAAVYFSRTGLMGDLERSLVQLPAGLPPSLTENPLFTTQGVIADGFQAEFSGVAGHSPTGDDEADPLRVASIAPQITRKTFLPTVVHFVQ